MRIAGVNVGQVTGLERKGNSSVVTFTVCDAGRPIHADASATIRPRIFLEGNFFIDLDPGSPSAPEMPDKATIPITRTSTAVQLDQVLTALQQPERANLQRLLMASARRSPISRPRPRTRPRTPTCRARAPQPRSTRPSTTAPPPAADRRSSTRRCWGAARRPLPAARRRQPDLQDAGQPGDAAQGADLELQHLHRRARRRSRPTSRSRSGCWRRRSTRAKRSLVDLNAALPALRGYAIAARPGIAELPATINAGLPWLKQAKPLLSKRELGGIASLLARGTPQLNKATQATLGLLPQLTKFNRCVTHNLIPAGNVVLQDNFGPYNFTSGQPNYREFFYAATGVSGESENFDGNGPYVRFQPGGGPVTVKQPNPERQHRGQRAHRCSGTRSRRRWASGRRRHGAPPIKSGKPCFKNAVPNLNGPAAAAGPPNPTQYP